LSENDGLFARQGAKPNGRDTTLWLGSRAPDRRDSGGDAQPFQPIERHHVGKSQETKSSSLQNEGLREQLPSSRRPL